MRSMHWARGTRLLTSAALASGLILLAGCGHTVVPDVGVPSDEVIPDDTFVVPDESEVVPENTEAIPNETDIRPELEEYPSPSVPAEMLGLWQGGFYETDFEPWLAIYQDGTWAMADENKNVFDWGTLAVEGALVELTSDATEEAVTAQWAVTESNLYGYTVTILEIGDRAYAK